MTDYPIPGEERTFRLPDLGEGLTEAEIVAWRVAVGDEVGIDQVVVDVETAKATVEVPCPHAGRVVTLHGAAGTMVEVGAPLITVAAPDLPGAGGTGGAASGAGGAASGVAADAAESGAVLVGYGTGNATLARRARSRAARATGATAGATSPAGAANADVTAVTDVSAAAGGPSRPASADVTPRPAGREPTLRAGTDNLGRAATGEPATGGTATTGEPATGGTATSGAPGAPRVLSPVVRRLARDRGVDVRVLAGSGPGGVVLRRDVEAATGPATANGPATAAQPTTATATTATGPATVNGAAADHVEPAVFPARPQRTSHPTPSIQREPLRGVRRAIADKLARSRREIPDATTWVDVDATALVEARDTLRAAAPDRPVGLLALLGRIAVAALARFPELNSSVEHDGDDLVLVRHGSVGLGFAAQTDRGLVVPVVHDAQELSTAELAAELTLLTDAARAGTLTPAQLTGGTFTLNNYGVFGVDGSTPIVNHPEAALLGVGRIVDKPWVVDGRLAVRKVTQLSLTFDHRVCDGGVAGGFLRYVADCVESPLGLLLDL